MGVFPDDALQNAGAPNSYVAARQRLTRRREGGRIQNRQSNTAITMQQGR
jgi:hypothetical protein